MNKAPIDFNLMRKLLDNASKPLPEAFGAGPVSKLRQVVKEIQGFRYVDPEAGKTVRFEIRY